MTLLLVYLGLALGVSFLCSIAEAMILSLPRAYVTGLVRQEVSGSRLLQQMKRDIDRPLAAILTLNTIAHTIGAAGVGAQALRLFGEEWVAATSAVLTLLILVLSEIIPKTLGAVYARRIAIPGTYMIWCMLMLTWPLVVTFRAFSRWLARGAPPHKLTREEVALIAEIGQSDGALQEKEYRVIRNMLDLGTVPVRDIMTPRTVVFMLSETQTVQGAIEEHSPLRFSRIPIYAEGPDDVTGVVNRAKIFEYLRDGQENKALREVSQPVHAVPETTSVAQVLNDFVRRREQIFLVIDEYGGTAGIVTLEDAVETLLGEEIVDETDPVTDMRELGERLRQARTNLPQAGD